MRRYVLALLITLVPAVAWADQTTMLHLTQSATVLVQPDDFVVGFAVQADAVGPATAQARVNRLAAEVLAEAAKVKGAKVDTGAYGVWQQGKPEVWHANQTIAVHGPDAAALLKLAGTAQAQGVTVQQLGWRLSPAAMQAAEQKAQMEALAALKARARQAATVLGLHFTHFQEVRLGPPPAVPVPRVTMSMAARAPGAPPPVAASEEQSVTQSVSGVAVLAKD